MTLRLTALLPLFPDAPAINQVAMTGRQATMTFAVAAEPVVVTADPLTSLRFNAGVFAPNRASRR